jgi:NADP-reducing hydrogenase subunit HndC
MTRLAHPGHLEDWRATLRDDSPAYERTIVVTAGTCGRASGALDVLEAFRVEVARLGAAGRVRILVTGCHGFCEMEPSVVVQPEGFFYGKLKPSDAAEIVEKSALKGKAVVRLACHDPATRKPVPRLLDVPFYRKQLRLLTEDNLRVDPERIEDYVLLGGYGALAKALFEMTAEGVIAEVKTAGLRGRGGAGFPTGIKWETGRAAAGHPKYVVCNADEGDPGAYMNRSLLEGNPNAILEGMIIGAYAIGASEGFVYVRSEYPLAVENVTRAVGQARALGLLGPSILGSEFHFDVHVVQGAGAFVSGEETALLASIEGRKAFPRQRPPFPAEAGLWGRPTIINNVETWANIPPIIVRGAEWFAGHGPAGSRGTKIFSLVGKVRNTGLVEVPLGTPLRTIIEDIGGGVPEGRGLKAVQTGGPSGGCLPASLAGLPLDFESLARSGSIMGSGGMIVMDDRTCMVDIARYFLGFTRDESCGKCAPCRIGTREMYDLLGLVTSGRADGADLERLESLARTVRDASLCGLGRTSVNPVLSTLTHFRAEYEAHVLRKECPAKVCRGLFRYEIVADLCPGCGICQKHCPDGAIEGVKKEPRRILQDKCSRCGRCFEKCAFESIAKV